MATKIGYFLFFIAIITSVFSSASIAVEVPTLQQAGRWPYGHVQPVTGDPSRDLIFAGVGGVVACMDAQLNKKGECVFPRVVKYLQFDSGRLYAADDDGVMAIDVQNPNLPKPVGLYATSIDNMTVSGNFIYIVSNNALQVLDATDPADIHVAGEVNILSTLPCEDYYYRNIFIHDNMLYIEGAGNCEESGTILFIDVSDPGQPSIVSTYSLPGIVLSGRFAPGKFIFTSIDETQNYIDNLRIIDISDPNSPTILSDFITKTKGHVNYVNGDHVYVGDIDIGLEIINIADPQNPVTVGTFYNGWNGVEYQMGNFLYFRIMGLGQLFFINVSDPTLGIHLFEEMTSIDRVDDFSISNNTACAVYGDSNSDTERIHIIDISDPDEPKDLGKSALPSGYYYSCMVSHQGDTAVLGSERGLLTILNISDPTDIKISGQYSITSDAYDPLNSILLNADHLFAGTEDGLLILDVSSPAEIIEVGRVEGDSLWGIRKNGDYLYAIVQGNVKIFNVTDPTNPQEVNTIQSPETLYGISVSDNLLCISGYRSFILFDISNPHSPVLVSTHETGYRQNAYISGTRLYSSSYDVTGGLFIYDVSEPVHPILLGSYDLPPASSDTIKGVSGDYVYTNSSRCYGYRIIDTSDVTSRSVSTPLTTSNHITDIHVSGDFGFAVDGRDPIEGFFKQGLRIFDLSDPADPKETGYYDFLSPGDAFHAVAVKGQYAYGDSARGLEILDVTDPVNPFQVDYISGSGGKAYDIEIVDDRLYLLGDMLDIYNISNPVTPIKIDTIPGEYFAIDGNVALTAGESDLKLMDISNNLHTTVSTYQVNDKIRCIALKMPYAYLIARTTDGFIEPVTDCYFRVIDFTNLTNPTEIGQCKLSIYNPPLFWAWMFSKKHTMKISGQYAYIPNDGLGVQLVDIGNPEKPYEAMLYDTPGEAYGLELSGEYLHVADGYGGIVTLELAGKIEIEACGKTYQTTVDNCISDTLACDSQGVTGFEYNILTHPENGTVDITNNNTGEFNYVPTSGFQGVDTFTFCLTNGIAKTEPATASITINPPEETGNGGSSGGCFINDLLSYD